MLASVLDAQPLTPGTAAVQLPDLHFARQGGTLSLSPENLAAGIDVDALSGPVQLTAPGSARSAGPAPAAIEGYLEFGPPVVEGDRLTLGLQVRAFPPGQGDSVPISTLSLNYARQDDQWVLEEPPAALSS